MNGSKRKIVLHGLYGAGNLGDEAILEASLRLLDRMAEGSDTVVWPAVPLPFHLRLKSANFRYLMDNLARFKQLKGADAFLLGGGGLLKDYGDDSLHVRLWLSWLRAARRMGVRTMLWSIGVENLRFERSKRVIRETINRDVDLVTVRDGNSKLLLEKIGVTKPISVTADPVFHLTESQAAPRRLGGKNPVRIMVSLRHWFNRGHYIDDEEANGRMLGVLSGFLDDLLAEGRFRIRLVPFRTVSHDDDRAVFYRIMSGMRHGRRPELIPDAPDAQGLMRLLHETDMVIGMRLHSLIFAASMGIPCLALSYMPKVSAFMGQMGQHRYCLDPAALDRGRLRRAFRELTQRYERVSSELVRASQEQRRRLDTNLRLLKALLES